MPLLSFFLCDGGAATSVTRWGRLLLDPWDWMDRRVRERDGGIQGSRSSLLFLLPPRQAPSVRPF
jgi:hypothetical protein